MHVYAYTYDTDHGYRKQMVRENVRSVSVSCQFKLIHAFMGNRSQTVVLKDEESGSVPVTSVVP